MCKKIVALILGLVMIFLSCVVGFFAFAAEKTVDANCVLFDNILENKPWIIESLVNGDFSNNC